MVGDNKDMEESIRTMVNMFRYVCATIFKIAASGPGQVQVRSRSGPGPGQVQVRSRSILTQV